MADYRFDSVLTGSDYRYGSVIYQSLTTRTIGNVSLDSAVPGTSYVFPLQGTWDAGSKSATLNGVALTITAEDANSITFTVPTPYADSSTFYLSNLNVAYDIAVTDTGGTVTKTGGFRIDAPAQPTYWYISSITGGPSWTQASVLYSSTGVSNGDSLIAEVTAGGPLVSFNTDGSWVASDPVQFRVKAYNADGWSASWASFVMETGETPGVVAASIGASGDTLTITISEGVWEGAGGNGGFTLNASGGAATLTYSSGGGTNTLVYTISREIDSIETVTLDYVQPGDGWEGGTGIDLFSISGVAVSNSSSTDTTPPTLDFARIARDGNSITLLFNEPVEFGAGGNTGFALTASGGAVTMTYSTAPSTRELTYTLSRAVADTETVTLAYTQPTNGVQDAAGNDLVTFTGKVVAFFTSDAVAVNPVGKPIIRKTVKSVVA